MPRRTIRCVRSCASDERPVQLLDDVRQGMGVAPGQPARIDYEYRRCGTCNLFFFIEPLIGWRHVEVTDRRTKIDFARQMKYLVDVRYPDADVVRVVVDNLNTHTLASLYEAFPPHEARRIVSKLEFHYTPKHGSWLNMAEIEIGICSRQCLAQRIPDTSFLSAILQPWETRRNDTCTSIDWRFTVSRARVKLAQLYPQQPS